MDQFISQKHFLTLKDAAEHSGYTIDYLTHLIQSKKITGIRLKHNWLIDRNSFSHFLALHSERKSSHASRVSHVEMSPIFSYAVRPHLDTDYNFITFSSDNKVVRGAGWWHPHLFAFLVAVIIMTSASFAANSSVLAVLTRHAGALSQEAASGFRLAFENIPLNTEAKFVSVSTYQQQKKVQVRREIATATALVALPPLVVLDDTATLITQSMVTTAEVAQGNADAFTTSGIKKTISLASVLNGLQILKNPQRFGAVVGQGYVAVGEWEYRSIVGVFSIYRSFITNAGDKTFTLGTQIIYGFRTLPPFINHMNLALGSSVIFLTHSAIQLDVNTAYGLASVMQTSSQKSFVAVEILGGSIERIALVAPGRVTSVFLAITDMPAHLAPKLARAVWHSEYTVASHFIAIVDKVSNRYIALVNGSGVVVYRSIAVVYAVPTAVNTWVGTTQLASVLHFK